MSDYLIMKAVEFDALPVKFKKGRSLGTLCEENYWLQKKYDGCFGIAILRADGSSQMLSRTGEDYTPSTKHLLTALRGELLDSGRTEGVFLGEIWHPTWDFPKISGAFRRQTLKGDEHELVYVAFDLLSGEEFQSGSSDRTYEARFNELCKTILDDLSYGSCTIAETYTDGEWTGDPVEHALRWKTAGGFDGAILRNAAGTYTKGTVKNGEIIKVKPVVALDLECIGVSTEKGEKTGRDVYTIDVVYKNVVTSVGSGMPHSFDKVPKCKDIVEIECMGFTEDGKLREPRFKGIRYDKLNPDN